jgi:hypothetical protein
MKYIIIILLVCFGFVAKAQVPTGFPSQRWAGYIEPTYVVPDSGTIISKRDTNFIPRFVGTTVTWQRPGIDTTFWFWNGRNWGRVSAAALDTTSLSNRINQKLNITDTVGKWLSQASRLVDTLYRVNDSTVGFTIKHTPYTFQILGRTPSSGTGTVQSVALSMPAAFSVSGSPITTSGTFNVSGAGTGLQYIKGNGTLGTTDTSMIPNFFSKVQGLFSGTSPITYANGVIGIFNANEFGQKGAATFNNTDFYSNGTGTIFIKNIPGAWCNIVKYGADTFGISDASPIVQSLINGGCKVIYAPHGYYKLNSTIQVKDSITIMGDGNSTVWRVTGNFPAFRAGGVAGGKYSSYRNFSILGTYNGDSTVGQTLQDGIRFDTAYNCYVNYVNAYKVGGYGFHFYNSGKGYGAQGSIVEDCQVDSSFGGGKTDSTAEFNTFQTCKTRNTHIGYFAAAGTTKIINCDGVHDHYGLFLTGGSNNGHATVVGGTFAHNDIDGVHMTGVSNGENFVGVTFRQNLVHDVYMEASDNVWFMDCDLGVDSIVSINCTNSVFMNNKYWNPITGRPGPPDNTLFRVVGDSLTITGSGYIKNAFSLYDEVDNKRFDIKHVNNVVDLLTSDLGKIRTIDTIETPMLIGSEVLNGNITILGSNINPQQSTVRINTKFFLTDSVSSNKEPMLGIGQTVYRGYMVDLQLKRRGTAWFHSENDSSSNLSAAGIRFQTSNSNRGDLFFTDVAFSNGAPADAFMAYTNGTGGMKLVPQSGNFEIAGAQAINTSSWFRIFNSTGNVVINSLTDNGQKLQVAGTSYFNGLIKYSGVTLPPSTYNVLVHGLTDSIIYQVPVSSLATGITSINSQTGPSITLAGSNGLTATTTSNTVTYTLGGSITGFTQLTGGGNSLLFGTSGSHLSGFTTYGDAINLIGNVRYGTEDYATDADHTVSSAVTFEELHDVPLTANRTLTLPSAVQQGQILTIVTRYSTGTNHFVLSSAIVDNSTGATFTQLDWGKRYDFYVDSAVGWILISKY